LPENLKKNSSLEKIEISPSKSSIVEVISLESLASKIIQQKEKSFSESSSSSSPEKQGLMASKII